MFELIQDYWLYFLIGQYPNGPLGGLALTVLLSSGALLLAMPLGLLLGVARVSPWRALRWPVAVLVQVVRALPLLLVVFWAYFFLPAVTGVKTGQATTMLMTLVLFDAVYLAEIVAAGIRALPKGQMESARSLGLAYPAALRLVVLPQALRHVLPSLVSQLSRPSRQPRWATSSGCPRCPLSPPRSTRSCSRNRSRFTWCWR
jgi:polar amino acid transport system permease protein